MQNIPLYSEDLIKLLDEIIPNKCPTLDDSERFIFYYAGKRSVVDALITCLENQQKRGE